MASVNQTRPHCVNQMGKTHSKPLAARHGRGTEWARHGNCILCVNRPLLYILVHIGNVAIVDRLSHVATRRTMCSVHVVSQNLLLV